MKQVWVTVLEVCPVVRPIFLRLSPARGTPVDVTGVALSDHTK